MNVTKNKIITIGAIHIVPSAQLIKGEDAEINFSIRGSEMSVAASLSSFGQEVAHLTVVSDDMLGEAAIFLMNKMGINTDFVQKMIMPYTNSIAKNKCCINCNDLNDEYYNNSFEHFSWNTLDWDIIFAQARCFVWSARFLTLGNQSQHLDKILQKASYKGIYIITDLSLLTQVVTIDYNLLALMLPYSTVLIAGVDDINTLLGSSLNSDKSGFVSACNLLTSQYPNITKIFDKVRVGSKCYGRGWVNNGYIETPKIEFGTIFNNEGTNESFTAGLLYILQFHEDIHALNFATAAFALNHRITEHYNTASVNQIIDTYQALQVIL